MNAPLTLTALRIAAVPALVVAFYTLAEGRSTVCCAIIALAAATDWLDGYLARRWRQTTLLGAWLDPVADKLLVVVALLLLIDGLAMATVSVAALLLVVRELIVSALREWMALQGRADKMAVIGLAKLKTAAQFGALLLLFWGLEQPRLEELPFALLGVGLLWFSVLLAWLSLWRYLRTAWPYLREGVTLDSKNSS